MYWKSKSGVAYKVTRLASTNMVADKDAALALGQCVLVPSQGKALFYAQGKLPVRVTPPTEIKPAAGEIVILTKAAGKGTVSVTVDGTKWTVSCRHHGETHSKSGSSEFRGQHGVMDAAVQALSVLKNTSDWTVQLSVSDSNVARMIRGEMKSRKHAPLLSKLRELVKDTGAQA